MTRPRASLAPLLSRLDPRAPARLVRQRVRRPGPAGDVAPAGAASADAEPAHVLSDEQPVSAHGSPVPAGTAILPDAPVVALTRLTLRGQMVALVVVAALCLAALGFTGIAQVTALSDATKDLARTSSQVAMPVARLRAQAERSSALIAQASATSNVLTLYGLLDELNKNDVVVAESVSALQEVLDPAVLGPVADAVGRTSEVRAELMELLGSGSTDFGPHYQGEYVPLVATLGTELDALESLMDSRLEESVTAASATVRRALVVVLVVLLAGFAGTALVALRVTRRIRRDVGDLQRSIESIAEGDLTRGPRVTTRDELGRAADALNTARASLGQLLAGVRETTDLVIEGAGRVETGTAQAGSAAASASEQAGTVAGEAGEVRSSVVTAAEGTEQLGVSIREIARSASEAAQMASAAGDVTSSTVATVLELERASEEIGEVVGAITRIAKQTNLLALNATIEAARAGAAGRGFAVVADEVKELSLVTERQAQDIGDRVGAIQAGTAQTVRRIEEVRDMVARISDMQTTIASAVEEQTATSAELGGSVGRASTGADRIAEAIASVAEATRMSSAVAQELRPEAEHLAGAARGLRERVDAFVF
ncbi:methyl-accepting chemotaxis protein [Sanguibacter sp. HDW7]|uniref:methyl-accepting chemotaxis protein n=1 Tax=Sanguibacter sp. HDW7 TaxID=2714931 RepID=UPI00140A7513|nr:methyl-accepting chemotaxis protein [Sanguibacter sp. HDW7]QIK84286.1 methyl-accepting chemotaxis protein [Sanguibacter sp. HDW7]